MNQLKHFLGIDLDIPNYPEAIQALRKDTMEQNRLFYIFIILCELILTASISTLPGGPFLKFRRASHFASYVFLILVTAAVLLFQRLTRKGRFCYHHYFAVENLYIAFLSLWAVFVTLNDQLGGNGLTVYTYAILSIALLSVMRPWQTAVIILASFTLLNLSLPYFPDPFGLDHSYNNLMNSLLASLIAIAISSMLFCFRVRSKSSELIIKKQLAQSEKEVAELSSEANLDALTGLHNRNSYKKALASFCPETCNSFSCLYIDANGLHELNNTKGHDAGDSMLKTAARIFLLHFRAEDVFRIGGDEFVILCRNISRDSVARRITTIHKEMAKYGYSVSVGLEWRDENMNLQEMLQAAELDMQKNKADYYALMGGGRQGRDLPLEPKPSVNARDTENSHLFLNSLSLLFKGVFFVDPEADSLRQLFVPDYFQDCLRDCDHKFSKALLLYAQRYVTEEYFPLFERVSNLAALKAKLIQDGVVGFIYEKKDGRRLKVQVMIYSPDAGIHEMILWIFSDLNSGTL